MSSLSPFITEKALHGIAGVPKSIKKLRSGDLVEYVNKNRIKNLLRTKTFYDLAVKVSLNSSLNTCKAIVCCPDLRGCSEQEILSANHGLQNSPWERVVVVALLFYVHGKHLRSCRDGQLT